MDTSNVSIFLQTRRDAVHHVPTVFLSADAHSASLHLYKGKILKAKRHARIAHSSGSRSSNTHRPN